MQFIGSAYFLFIAYDAGCARYGPTVSPRSNVALAQQWLHHLD
jgi:hypothetical protein